MRNRIQFFLIVMFVLCPSIAQATARPRTITPNERVQIVRASWYGPGFHGKKTSNGETFDKSKLTAAHPSLPLPTTVRVTYPARCAVKAQCRLRTTHLDGLGMSLKKRKSRCRSEVVRINDRGPYVHGRGLDLSEAAARKLGTIDAGVALVRLEVLP